MWIFVARFTFVWRGREVHIQELAFEIRWTMAGGALHGTMRSGKREFRAVVIEAVEVAPGLC